MADTVFALRADLEACSTWVTDDFLPRLAAVHEGDAV